MRPELHMATEPPGSPGGGDGLHARRVGDVGGNGAHTDVNSAATTAVGLRDVTADTTAVELAEVSAVALPADASCTSAKTTAGTSASDANRRTHTRVQDTRTHETAEAFGVEIELASSTQTACTQSDETMRGHTMRHRKDSST